MDKETNTIDELLTKVAALKIAYVTPDALVPPQPSEQPVPAQATQSPAQPPVADPIQELMGAMEQLAMVMDDIKQRNTELERRVQDHESRQAAVDAKQDMLLKLLQNPAV